MPKGPRKFHFSFEKSGLIRFGGTERLSIDLRQVNGEKTALFLFLIPEHSHRTLL
jgi:hypothetical protein